MFSPAGRIRTLAEPVWSAVNERNNVTVKGENNLLKAKAIALNGVYIPSDKCHKGTAIDQRYCRSMRQLREEQNPQQMYVKNFKINLDGPDANEMRQLQWAIFLHKSVADCFYGADCHQQISPEVLGWKEQEILGDVCPEPGYPDDVNTSLKEATPTASRYPMNKGPVNTEDKTRLPDPGSLSICAEGTPVSTVVTRDVAVQTDSEQLCDDCRIGRLGTG